MEEAFWKNCRRLGVMGGTFDPIHYGHLLAAEAAWEGLELDKVLFIPAGRPSFKRDRDVTPGRDRYEMVRLAIADNPSFAVSPMEIDREGITYTLDTLEALRREFTGELFFITGSDAVKDLDRWKGGYRLLELCTFVTVLRPGYRQASAHPAVRVLEAPAMDVSSSGIRQRAAEGRSIRYLTPPAVEAYIWDRHLYQEGNC